MCLILNHLLFAFKYTFLYLAQEMVQSQEFFLVVTSPPIFSTKILDGGNSTEFPDRALWGGSEDARRAVGTYCGSRRRQILLLRLRPVAPEVHAGAGLPSHGPPPSWKGLQWSNHQCVLCLALRIRRTLPKTFQEGSLTSAPRKTWSSPSRGGKEKGAWWRGARPAARGGQAPRPRVRCCSRLGALLPQTHGPRRTGVGTLSSTVPSHGLVHSKNKISFYPTFHGGTISCLEERWKLLLGRYMVRISCNTELAPVKMKYFTLPLLLIYQKYFVLALRLSSHI